MKTLERKTVTGYPFVHHVDQTARPEIDVDSKLNYFKVGGYSSTGEQIKQTGCVKIGGYRFDLRPFLKRFVYRQGGRWDEAYAPNKTALRKVTYGQIDEILEA